MIMFPYLHSPEIFQNWTPKFETSTQKSKTSEMGSFTHFPSKISTARPGTQNSGSHARDAFERLPL
jgi:hypothetical protein